MQPLSPKQRQLLSFIELQLRENHPPSQREIADHLSLSQNAACQLVRYLRKKGYLVNTASHRGLRLSPQYQQQLTRTMGIPVVGRVAAGEPILAEQNIERYLDPTTFFAADNDTFLLKVVGDSMIDEGIMPGDYVVIKPQSNIANGQIAVVLLDDEATVKRVSILQHDRISFKSANRRAGYKTKIVKATDKNVRIIGKVIGCLRYIH